MAQGSVCLHLSTEYHHSNTDALQMFVLVWTKKRCPRKKLQTGVIYFCDFFIFVLLFALHSVEDLWVLVPLPRILLPMRIDSPIYPVLFTSNASLEWPFTDLVTTQRRLEGPWKKYSTMNVSSLSTCAKLYNMTMGDFLDNVSNGTTLGLELLASLTNYKLITNTH